MKRWGALPMDDEYYPPERGRCTNCGQPCPHNYEHCDDCLMKIVRGINAVDRAVRKRRARH